MVRKKRSKEESFEKEYRRKINKIKEKEQKVEEKEQRKHIARFKKRFGAEIEQAGHIEDFKKQFQGVLEQDEIKKKKAANTPLERIKREFITTEEKFRGELKALGIVREMTEDLPNSKGWKNFKPKEKEAIKNLNELLAQCKKVEESSVRLLNAMKDKGLNFDPNLEDVFKKHLQLILKAALLQKQFLDTAAFMPATLNKKINEALSKQKANSLDAILITPVQRIPRYELLFKELLKNVPDAEKARVNVFLDLSKNKGAALNESLFLKVLPFVKTTADWRKFLVDVSKRAEKGAPVDFGAISHALQERKNEANKLKDQRGPLGRLRTEAKEAREFLGSYASLQGDLTRLGMAGVPIKEKGFLPIDPRKSMRGPTIPSGLHSSPIKIGEVRDSMRQKPK